MLWKENVRHSYYYILVLIKCYKARNDARAGACEYSPAPWWGIFCSLSRSFTLKNIKNY